MSVQNKPSTSGLTFSRRFTKQGVSPYDMFDYVTRSSTVYQADGKAYAAPAVEVPQGWNQSATDKLVKNYFSQLGVAAEEGVAQETTVKAAVHHMAMSWKQWGEQRGYFASERDGEVFYDELAYSILSQQCVPNGSHWLRTCIEKGEQRQQEGKGEAASRSHCKQPHACFLLGLMNKVMDYGQ